MKRVRWPDGVVKCPRCQGEKVSFITTRKLWTCKECKTRKQFTIKVGTIMEDSAIPFDKWLCAFWLIASAKNGISSYEIGRSLGVTQKTGWFMLQRIRLCLQGGESESPSRGGLRLTRLSSAAGQGTFTPRFAGNVESRAAAGII